MVIVLEFLAFFLFILILGYLLPAGTYYWKYHVALRDDPNSRRIQQRRPDAAQIKREVQLSLISILIFALMATGVFQLYKAGMTSIYWEVRSYPLIRFPLSVLLCMVIHDTFFYWSHRFMHWRPVFKYTHVGHHRSISPTPWAIYAFQPAEAVIQFVGIALIVIFVPLHPAALLLFLFLDTQMNTAGHAGHEVIPAFIAKSPLYWGLNTVTHHDTHHTNMGKNFGSFFNVWDRLMGTFLDRATPDYAEHASAKEGRAAV